MQVRTKKLSYAAIGAIVCNVARASYDGNIAVHPDSRELYASGYGMRGRLYAPDSYGLGARTSASGRHGPYTCWHAYRDALQAIFERDPSAIVVTMFARYKGMDGFLNAYPETAHINMGSRLMPAYMPDLCDCEA